MLAGDQPLERRCIMRCIIMMEAAGNSIPTQEAERRAVATGKIPRESESSRREHDRA
jgi:hypothetical protein